MRGIKNIARMAR